MKRNRKRIYPGWDSLNGGEADVSSAILRINFLPPVVMTFVLGGALYVCYSLGGFASEYLRRFVEFLLIPKVLNLPILQNPLLYSSAGYLVFGYIGLAFVFDWIRFLRGSVFTSVYLRGDVLYLETRSLTGRNILRWKRTESGARFIHQTGVLRKLLGLERIVISLPDMDGVEGRGFISPYFFRKKNGDLLRGLSLY
ncbi:hypothetical protein EHQ12_14360 [Leptospira gomenensis]|uniref:Uncharacterized protein n=1 Tax=Leptospira gomenensis TaxID=2484974 RepID=A0A5F1YBU3_9LEPT|nr:hypothetical protein [Leptospira gomenensis]TGK33857.1 hypothetical protein EHQ17_10160 [Leptospira gomenensis]TGK36312.1 hypothetical protein EHQ12_14360 [Leptospira gomenensis]TGK52082.1 hypothetical protein EHQ07_00455 [Leptospira gomenensis]TGK59869.1 hypothetical protein EHQ13_11600 [Leptospira gomenensis]